MAIRVLDAIADRLAWHQVLDALQCDRRDVYFEPEYLTAHALLPGARGTLFVFSKGGDIWANAFVRSPIRDIGAEVSILASGLWDIESAYGYAGPLSSSDEQCFILDANTSFHKWCAEEGIVAEFLRLHPIINNKRWILPPGSVQYDRMTASMDLRRFGENPWMFDSATRSLIRRPERDGVSVRVRKATTFMGAFCELYERTMRRVGATEYYFFTAEYFAALAGVVDRSGWLLLAERGTELVGGAVFLRSALTLNYHLSATEPSARVPGVTNRLLWEAAQLGAASGCLRFHLGGGRSSDADDSLWRFKLSMATDRHEFHIVKRVHLPGPYERLRAAWARDVPGLVPVFGGRLLCYRYTK